jgi:hypothetical protein
MLLSFRFAVLRENESASGDNFAGAVWEDIVEGLAWRHGFGLVHVCNYVLRAQHAVFKPADWRGLLIQVSKIWPTHALLVMYNDTLNHTEMLSLHRVSTCTRSATVHRILCNHIDVIK